MDLEEFDVLDKIAGSLAPQDYFSARDALDYIDSQWYTKTNRRARWMDLLGDYAGSEPFIIDGESLLQLVLDDPLLALGRDECSFQIIHALQSLEHVLANFSRRNAEFEIVFWEENRHLTLQTGYSTFTVASRSLARRMLFQHLLKLDIPVHTFAGLSDQSWLRYRREKKPMFVMVNDGGLLETNAGLAADCILCQRVFLFDLLCHGIPVTLLRGCEFRDSKILSFVYEQRLDAEASKLLPPGLRHSVEKAHDTLNARDNKNNRFGIERLPLTSVNRQTLAKDSCLVELSRLFLSLKSSKSMPPELLHSFLVHCILLEDMPVRERARPLELLHPDLLDVILKSFFPDIFIAAEHVISTRGLALDLDGRVLASLINFLVKNRSRDMNDLVGCNVVTRVYRIWSDLGAEPIDLEGFAARYPSQPPPPPSIPVTSEPLRLLPFDNEVFNDELKPIHIGVEDQVDDTSSAYMDFGGGTLFSDTQHWHNTRKAILPSHLGGTNPKPMDERQRRRFLRSEQRFMATLQRQAGTLTGALGASLQQIVIPPVGNQESKALKVRPAIKEKQTQPKGKKGKEQLSSKEKLLKEITDKKKTVQDTSSQSWWLAQLETMKKLTNSNKIVHLVDLYRNKKSQELALATEMRLYRLHLELIEWIDDIGHDTDAVRDRYTVSVMRIIKDICDRGKLTPTISTYLAHVFTCLGFPDYAASALSVGTTEDRALSFEFIKVVKSKGKTPLYKFMHITEHPTVWQLRLFGEFMDRSMDGKPDPRVAFVPDAWQREVLDCIDEDGSLLVVAPTSAGKTFISYYAMEKVLRESDDGILVYVAPTKALVSQIAAEVYARFSKNLTGRSCWSVHTRDYRIHDPQKCQILVTVPEMLAIMLLSPPLARVWTPRIKRIVLDEIHSIGQQEGGAIWEQILLLAPCPIIGLSATIGSPEIFNTWLQSVQNAHGYKHTYIRHPHRYSHLRKFYYMLQSKRKAVFQGLDTYRSSQRSKFLHPIAMLSFGTRSLPDDLALEAPDTLSLYHALRSCSEDVSRDLDALDPTKFFSGKTEFLRQKDILEYEASLKHALIPLISSYDPHDPASPLHAVVRKVEDPGLSQISEIDLNMAPEGRYFRANLIYLVSDLCVQGDLPAILFNFDRNHCEIMAQDLITALQTAEEKWRQSSPEWNRKLRAWEQWKLHAKDRERLAEKVKKQKKDPDAEPAGDHGHSWESSFDPGDPSSEFSFAGTRMAYSKTDLDGDVKDLAWTSTPQWAVDGLRRGIAVHHAGMNKRYRSLVESLFRGGFVRVIIATGTLALGINAPTRTSVFCGDSPFLTALMYRQCAGRAGRRGYDLLGNVVFYGLAMDRVQRLVLSKLPSLGGNFPLTSTLCLRLFNLLEGSNYAPVAKKAIKSIMQLPHISFGSDTGRNQLMHHLRFSIDYLQRARLLDHTGKPMNLFSTAAHLYYTEPSNFALVALLRNGVLHRMCAQPSLLAAKNQFILLMSHLFGRRYLVRSYTTKKNIDAIIRNSPSMVVLPPLSPDARKVLVQHDKDVLRVFTAYALTFASQYGAQLEPDYELPLSKQSFLGSSSDDDSLFRRHLRNTAIPVIARSSFVANSGHGDVFRSVEELTGTVRRGLDLNEHAIPSLERIVAVPDKEGAMPFALNAYLLDFYTHGQVAALAVANGIRRGDVWYLLQDFMLTLMTVRTSLEQLLLKASQEAEANAASVDDEDALDVDSGYGSFEPGEMDDDGELGSGETNFKRPGGVVDRDWRVYEVVNAATREFEEKYKAMWA